MSTKHREGWIIARINSYPVIIAPGWPESELTRVASSGMNRSSRK